MTDPATVSKIGMGGSIAGGIFSAFGNLMSGNSNKQMYEYKAKLAQINAQVALQNRDYSLQKGELDAQTYGIKAGQQLSGIRSAQSSSGIDINSGSAKRVQDSQHGLAVMDLNQIRSNAAKTAYDFTVQATQFQNEAQLDQYAAKKSATAGWIGAAGSIVGTAGSVADKWLQGKQLGYWGND